MRIKRETEKNKNVNRKREIKSKGAKRENETQPHASQAIHLKKHQSVILFK